MELAAPASEPRSRGTGRRIVITTFGSLGDLHPFIAVAQGLQARGHDAIIATSRHHRQRIEARGIGFHALRPVGPDLNNDREAMRLCMDSRKGTEFVIREIVMPALGIYEDVLAAAQGADLLVSHVFTFGTRLVAEKTGVPWAGCFLQPVGFFSAYDPPVLAPAPFLSNLRFLGSAFHRTLFWLARRSCRSWSDPWRLFRAELHLPPTSEDPLFEGIHSPFLVLAMFSPLFASKQRDWPQQTVVSGFPFSDEGDRSGMPPELVRFLDAGPPPIVFTLGSSAVLNAGPFFEQSAAAAGLLGRRAILIVGQDPENRPATLPDGVMACDYVPFSLLFPRAAAIVHPGGIGTIALAMRADRPMLVMPCAHDQFDNAARATRLGIARSIPRHRYSPTRIAAELRHLLENQDYSRRAAEIGEKIRRENGVGTACDALEALLPARPRAEAVVK